jgi:hypothetical protein
MRRHKRIPIASFLLAILMASGSGSLQAQGGRSVISAPSSRPQFEVASIKPNRSLAPPRAGFRPKSEPVPPDGTPAALAPSDGPSIFAAVQEQLGLRLESGRALLDVLIIDAIERPSPN